MARADEAHRAACRARLVRASAWRIVLEDAAAPGAYVAGSVEQDGCRVRALLIADQRAIDPAMRDRFAAAGIVHMLSISGLHVAIIAAAVRLLFVALRLRPAPAMIAT